MSAPDAEDREIRVGVSSCLLGERVRYDAGHKHDRYLTDVLGPHFRFIAVCPEVEAGMGTPREPVRLVREGATLRMLGVRSGDDHTDRMMHHARRRVAELQKLRLSGYVLKKGSPSCGMERVRTYTTKGMPAPSDRGLFAAELVRVMPLLPVEEEGRLIDDRLRENFIERVFAYKRIGDLFSRRWTIADLVKFHTREKMLVCSHVPAAEKELGRIVAAAKGADRARIEEDYRAGFLRALSRPATVRRHVNVLQHMLGHFRDRLEAPPRRALASTIEDYRGGLVPLIVPITLLRHYVDLYEVAYLAHQTYLEPHPKELMLRNHV